MTKHRLKQLLALLKEDESDSFLLFAVAKEYEKLGELEAAKSYFLRLKSLDRTYVGTYYHLGKLYEKSDHQEEALSTYQEGIEVAKEVKDQHALSELMNAKMNLELEL